MPFARSSFVAAASAVFTAGVALAPSAAAQLSPAFFQTLTLDPAQSLIDLDLTIAQTTNRVGGEVDVQYDLGPGQGQTIGVPALRGVLVEPVDVDLGLFTITAPANSITVTATAAPGSLQNPATPLPSIPEVSAYQFTQPDVTLSLTGILTLDNGETSIPIDLSTVAPSTDQSITDAQLVFDLGINNPPSTTLIAPIDSIFALPLDDLTIPVLITGTLTATSVSSIPCDFDGNGVVDQGDLNLVLTNWGGPRSGWGDHEDFTTALVDQEELNCVLENWGRTSATPAFEQVNLPEPGAALGLAGLGVAWVRRRA